MNIKSQFLVFQIKTKNIFRFNS